MATIKKLPDHVINKIAAGEVIYCPKQAVKELIENSIDAQCTSIQVQISEGGFRSIKIIDNGQGISQENLSKICSRYSTSKLTNFDDFQSLNTFGFRGEALSSISQVADLTITSKTADSQVAFKANFFESKKSKIETCAGNQGTVILVENMFSKTMFNRSKRNVTEEYSDILKMIQKYSIEFSEISFSVSKTADSSDYVSPSKANPIDVIRLVYGNQLAKDLVTLATSSEHVKVKGFITPSTFNQKKKEIIFFVNGRLVEIQSLEKIILLVYSQILPQRTFPFIFFSLKIPSSCLDVNVHPSKMQVTMLFETEIVELISNAIRNLLSSRTSYNTPAFSKMTVKPIPASQPVHFVRVDSADRTLDSFKRPKLETLTKIQKEQSLDQESDGDNTILQEEKEPGIIEYCKETTKFLRESVLVGSIDHDLIVLQRSDLMVTLDFSKIKKEIVSQLETAVDEQDYSSFNEKVFEQFKSNQSIFIFTRVEPTRICSISDLYRVFERC